MGKIRKVIFFRGAVETLGYFSEQLASGCRDMGMDVYFVDYERLFETVGGLSRFAQRGDAALLTFNFIGLRGEGFFNGENGRPIWESLVSEYFIILVDHPLYYHSCLLSVPDNATVFCIDREHAAYIRRFYPGVLAKFMPTAGNVLPGADGDFSGPDGDFSRADCDLPREGGVADGGGAPFGTDRAANSPHGRGFIPYEKRRYGIVFTANYVPPEQLYERIDGADPEYKTFYRGILDDLLESPSQSVDVVMERHIAREIGNVSDGDIRAAMSGMILLDLCARTILRGEIVRELAEADVPVAVFGADWDKLPCKKPWNILGERRQVSSADCVRAVADARVSLNVMPWFKDGAHDRVFTAMLQKTVSLTDDSRYLRREFDDGEDLVFFSLEGRRFLPDLARMLLCNAGEAARIAENGYKKAAGRHTWRARAREIFS